MNKPRGREDYIGALIYGALKYDRRVNTTPFSATREMIETMANELIMEDMKYINEQKEKLTSRKNNRFKRI